MKRSIFILFLCLIYIFTLPYLVSAQTTNAPTDVNVDMIPENPGPNQTVNVTLTSYGTQLDAANIAWKINGSTKQIGKGLKTFSFNSGSSNTTTTLGISITTAEGENITKSIKVSPSTVDLIWQSYGFVPAFYKGKSMFSHQDQLTIIAMPHLSSGGQEISSKNLIYKWKLNGSVIEAVSGYGKNTYNLTGSLISRPFTIDVEVTSANVPNIGTASININPVDPSIVIYKKNPLYGIEFQKALNNVTYTDSSKEAVLVGMPFFFGTLNPTSSDLTYTWEVNGASVGNDPHSATEVFRQKEGAKGSSSITLSVENANKILQSASTNFKLDLSANNSNSSQ